MHIMTMEASRGCWSSWGCLCVSLLSCLCSPVDLDTVVFSFLSDSQGMNEWIEDLDLVWLGWSKNKNLHIHVKQSFLVLPTTKVYNISWGWWDMLPIPALGSRPRRISVSSSTTQGLSHNQYIYNIDYNLPALGFSSKMMVFVRAKSPTLESFDALRSRMSILFSYSAF